MQLQGINVLQFLVLSSTNFIIQPGYLYETNQTNPTDVKESKQRRANKSTMNQTLKQAATETKHSGKDFLYSDLNLMILD